MIWRPPGSMLTYPLFPCATLVRSGKAHQQHQFVLVRFGALLLQCGKIVPVHGQDEIEITEVVGRSLAGFAVIDFIAALARGGLGAGVGGLRSEEHPSDVQSLMRISYAGFCLKKKNQLQRRSI